VAREAPPRSGLFPRWAMLVWRRKKHDNPPAAAAEARLRQKYASFRALLSLNNECLELMAGVQEDLRHVSPLREVFASRVSSILDKAGGIVESLETLTGVSQRPLVRALEQQRQEVERYLAEQQELSPRRLSAWLNEVNLEASEEVGGKAAALGEIKNRLGLPVPDGFVLTTEAYRQFCGLPLWKGIQGALRRAGLDDLEGLQAVSAQLMNMVMEAPVPRALEVAVGERARVLARQGVGLAVRSSAVGEGGALTFAGQFLSLINVPPGRAVDAYKRVVAGRYGERALSYRLSTGVDEAASPMAVLFLPVIHAAASGILYTRDPEHPRSDSLWLTSTRGLGLDMASGRVPADLFVVSHKRPHSILEQRIVRKEEEVVLEAEGGVKRRRLDSREAEGPSLEPEHLKNLADWGIRIEQHFSAPQDIEWALEPSGRIWILQSRPLVLAEHERSPARPREEPTVAGGSTVYPGRVSGLAYWAEDRASLRKTPQGAILLVHRASPEIIAVLPRIAGLVAECGNMTGHAATLLREFKVPSVFQMENVSVKVRNGDALSLDAVQPGLFRGTIWPPATVRENIAGLHRERASDPLSRRLLTLHLQDAGAFGFRPGSCQSVHDVLRYCHEKGVEAMFAMQDREMEHGPHRSKKLLASVPVNLYVLDLGGGLAMADPDADEVTPAQIVSRPFQALWKGIAHPSVSWTRRMSASFSDLASVIAGSFAPESGAIRALGDRSYLLVASEYLNLNSRLAYHFSLVDASLSDNPSSNYIAFRFAGGGSTRQRRNLRACFLESCLAHYGFVVDRRGDLVNAWFKRACSEETEANLDILGRLMACSCQLDMYMNGSEAMQWYVEQFLAGNYSFQDPRESAAMDRVSLP
jgi:pyruvate, water dikinase